MVTKILLADDHEIIREGICSLIEKQSDMEVVGQVCNGQEAIEMSKQLSPDIIIMDVGMPGINGIEATRQIKAAKPEIKIIALSIHDNRSIVLGMAKAGMSGYLLKECAFGDLIQAIKIVLSDGTYLSPKIASVVLEESIGTNTLQGDTTYSIPLREHEIRVLKLLADGKSTRKIAGMLNMSVKTIEGNRRQIMKKLGIYSFAALVKYAVKEHLVSGDNVFVKP
jgi:two-component system, NarL family, response regulator NreC